MKKLIAANWKMFKTWSEGMQTARELLVATRQDLPADREVLLIPSFTLLKGVGEVFSGVENYYLGAQNFYPEEQGAYTGEISPVQLKDLGCSFALAGHSERRHVLGETDEFVGQKVRFGLEKGLNIILCIGEKIEERKKGQVEEVLHRQLAKGLAGVEKDIEPQRLSIAYEPVWAIGTGEVAGPKEIVHAHTFIRNELAEHFQFYKDIRILYGGSVKPDNASQILGLDNVDGVLVGGASLKAESFSQIVLAE
jgi:triosephosphate isomerase